MRVYRIIGLSLVLGAILTCGRGKDTTPDPTTLERIRAERARLLPLVDLSLYADSGDSTIFSGLLSRHFPLACDTIKASQLSDGSFARSPAHAARGDRDFSRDGAVGVLWAVKSGCLDSSAVVKFAEFINGRNGCLSIKCDSKSETSGTFRRVIQEVTGQPIKGAWLLPPTWTPFGQSYFQEGSDKFLSYAILHLLGGSRSADDRENPFQLLVEGSRKEAADKLLPLMVAVRGQEVYRGEATYLRWSLQWPMARWEDPRIEELIWASYLVE